MVDHARAENPALQNAVVRTLVLHIRRNAAAAEHFASGVGGLGVVGVLRGLLAGVVVIEEGAVGVVALDQAAAGRVVVGDGEQQRGALIERKLRLHQALSESGISQDERAI